MIDLCDFKKFGKLLWGRLFLIVVIFTWVKSHQQIFIKIGTLQLIYYN